MIIFVVQILVQMEKYKPTVTFFLDKRSEKAGGKSPLKMTVYQNPDKKRYSIGIDLTPGEWQKLNGTRLMDDNLKEIKIRLGDLQKKAFKVINELEPFSFTSFEEQFFAVPKSKDSFKLSSWFEAYIEELDKAGRVGTSISYKTSLNSLLSYKGDIRITEIDKKYLIGYETFMKNQGKSGSTIGIYLRQLRAIVNKAIDKKVIKQENYPFKGFEIPGSRNVKKALNDDQLRKLLKYKTSNEQHQKALDFWILSYLCNGMNFTDILHLRPEDINGNFLSYIRQKTIRTKKKDLRPIKVALPERALEIIETWRTTNPSDHFLFPVLYLGISARTVKHRTQSFIKSVNKAMEAVRKELKIEQKIGTYAARHSFSSRLMRQGVNTHYIKESLGHSSVAVTENYLGDFEDVVKQEYANLLVEL